MLEKRLEGTRPSLRVLGEGVLRGVGTGVLIVLLGIVVFNPLISGDPLGPTNLPQPSPAAGALASVGAGITEEILFRLGLVTLPVWLGVRLGPGPTTGSDLAGLGAVVAVALAFGAARLPATAEISRLTPAVVARSFVPNAVAGIVFGWLCWRRGLLAAMVGRFSTDIVLHALVPLLVGVLVRGLSPPVL